MLRRLNWLKPCDTSSSATAAASGAPRGMGDFSFHPSDGCRGDPASRLGCHSLGGPPKPTTCHPVSPASWGISGLMRCLPTFPVLWSHACCDTELSDAARNPAKPLELGGQQRVVGVASFIFCVNATVELWFLWNAVCVGWSRAKTPCEVLSSAFKAISDCPGSRQLNNRDFFYSLGSKSLVLSSRFALRWQCKPAINVA